MKKNFYLLLTVVIVILIAGVTFYLAHEIQNKPKFDLATVKTNSITQGLNTTGTVVAAQDISLAFQSSGTISQVNVTAGNQVKAGQLLLSLNNQGASAAVAVARASVETAQANYQKVINGATSEQVQVNQTALANAQKNLSDVESQQQVLVSNANRTLLNSSLAATPTSGNVDTIVPTISGAYNGTTPGSYNLSLYSTGSGLMFSYTGLETGSGPVSLSPQLLGKDGLVIQFPSVQPSVTDTWTVNLPNTQGATYLTNYNAYQSALETQTAGVQAAQSAVDAAQSALSLMQTTARPEDVAAAQAQVDAAEAQLQSASAVYNNGLITAPTAGTITDVGGKIGEVASPGEVVANMISSQTYQIQTFISEGQLPQIKIGDTAQVTLDAYGSGVNFPATIIAIDPAATDQGGDESYKVTLQFTQNDDRIKEGMGANIVVTDQQKSNVVSVPAADVFTDGTDKFVLVSSSTGPVKTIVTTGLEGVDGSVEITSGLSAGAQIVSLGQ